ncbi:MAG: hypothetical protein H6743_03780 [Rickettsiaceae bacterium]|nr:hypothetical protein [Rickettsiaceae bacterium]
MPQQGTYNGQTFNLADNAYNNQYYQTGFGGIVPIVSQQDLENVQAAGLTPFTYNAPDTSTTTTTTPNPLLPENTSSTPQSFLDQAEQQLGGAFQSSFTPQSIAEQLRLDREARKAEAESIFGPRIRRAEEVGAAQVSTTEGVTGQRSGFALSTAELALIDDQQKKVDTAIKEIQDQKQAYISSGNAEAQARADAALAQLEDRKLQFILKRADLALQLGTAARQQSEFDFNVISNLAAGQTWTDPTTNRTYTGIAQSSIDPFFSGSDIISLMKALPQGETQTLTDPNTGQEMTITGLATTDDGIKTVQTTDSYGNVRLTSYRITDAGAEVLNQVSLGNVGKGITGGGTTDTEEKAFLADIKDVAEKLANEDWEWASAYNYINTIYGRSNPDLTTPLTPEEVQALGGVPGVDQNRLDIFLNKSQYYNQ